MPILLIIIGILIAGLGGVGVLNSRREGSRCGRCGSPLSIAQADCPVCR